MSRTDPTAAPSRAAITTAPSPSSPGDWAQADPLTVPGLTVLAHPDPSRIGERVDLTGVDRDREVGVSRLEPAFVAPGGGEPRGLDDEHLSRRPWRLGPGRAANSVRIRPAASRMRLAVDGEPLAAEKEVSAEELRRGVVLTLAHRIVLLLHHLDPIASPCPPFFELVGESAPIVRLREDIRRVADLEVPVLLRGETGTGKELVAQAIHRTGPRSAGPMVAVNMAAVPSSLAAAELFGAERGAFTGAERRRRGHFLRAHQGTLFLDEIGEAPPDVQTLLLRCLESREIHPVGADQAREIDVRVIAATDLDLEAAAAAGRFNAPLVYRLAGYVVPVPPLRQRRDDLGRLLLHFLRQELDQVGEGHRLTTPPGGQPYLPADLVARLALYDWPGNIRQLRNVVRQLVISSRGAPAIRLHPSIDRLLAGAPTSPSASTGADPPPTEPPRRSPAEIREAELVEALRSTRFRPQAAAELLGTSRTSIYALIEKSPRLRKATDLDREELEACRRRHGGHLEKMVDELEVSEAALKRRMTKLGIC